MDARRRPIIWAHHKSRSFSHDDDNEEENTHTQALIEVANCKCFERICLLRSFLCFGQFNNLSDTRDRNDER
jgi:hypothetical protein